MVNLNGGAISFRSRIWGHAIQSHGAHFEPLEFSIGCCTVVPLLQFRIMTGLHACGHLFSPHFKPLVSNTQNESVPIYTSLQLD